MGIVIIIVAGGAYYFGTQKYKISESPLTQTTENSESYWSLVNEIKSPNGQLVAIEKALGDGQKITIQTLEKTIIKADLIQLDNSVIKSQISTKGMCAIHIKNWIDNNNLKIQVICGNGDELEYLINVKTGVVDPESMKKVSSVDETADWNIYKNPEGYFTVKYPPTLLLKEEKAGTNSACETGLILADKVSGFSKEYQGDITIDICQVLEEFYPKGAFSNIEGRELQPITIDSVKGYKKTGQADFAKLGSRAKVERVALYFRNKEYTLDLRYIPNHPNFESTFDQILSTFKFTQ